MVKMIRDFNHLVIIFIIILFSIPRFEAAKKDIVNFHNGLQSTMDNKTQAVMNLTRKCLLDENLTLVVSAALNEKLLNYFYKSEAASIVSFASSELFTDDSFSASLDNKERYCNNHNYRFLWKSTGFLIAASSPAFLKQQLDYLKNSRWWNSVGIFIFTDDDTVTITNCANAYEFLSLGWKYNLLSSIYICQEQDGSSSIYTFNPYADSAPQPWVNIRKVKGQPHEHPWNLFKWEKYQGTHHTCKNIFFDKTTKLNGYPITTNALKYTPFLYYYYNETGLNKYAGEDGRILRVIWRFFNASIIDVKLSDENAVLGWVDDNGTIHGNLIDISSGKVDIGFNSQILQPAWKVTPIYPHTSVNICFMTKSHGFLPWLIALTMIFDNWTKILAIAIFLMGTIIFGYLHDKGGYFSSFLNMLRVVISTSFIRPPSSNGLRILLGFILLMPIISYSTIQGNILSLIQNPVGITDFEDFDALASHGYHIEGPELLKTFIPSDRLKEQFVPENDIASCIRKIQKDKPVACISYCFSILVKASKYKYLHVAKNKSPNYPNRYIAKLDWPLAKRFNQVLQRLVEAGLPDYYRSQSIIEKSASISPDDPIDTETVAAVIRLKDFRYVFVGLGIGWAFAILAFIGELIIGRSKTKKIYKMRKASFDNILRRFHRSRT